MSAAGGGRVGQGDNGRPLSYTPYQSHRRTASQRSTQSFSQINGSNNNNAPAVSSPLANPVTKRAPQLPQASPSATLPAPVSSASVSTVSASTDLPAPPPLRRIQRPSSKPSPTNPSVGGAAPSGSTNGISSAHKSSGAVSNPAPSASHNRLLPHQQRFETSSRATRESNHEQDVAKQSRSPSISSAETLSRPLSPDTSHERGVKKASASSRRLDVNLPASKQISTSQALRMREKRADGINGSGEGSGSSSPWETTSDQERGKPLRGDFEASLAFSNLALSTEYGSVFQPRGVSRSRMPDFAELRDANKGKGKAKAKHPDIASMLDSASGSDKLERKEERIRRRVEKLIAIHYGDPSQVATSEASASPSLSSSLLTTLAPHSRFLTTLRRTSTTRSLEQSLVPWQPDDAVTECPFCQKSFGGLGGRRKHHCRACGRVVCASPEVAAAQNGPDSSLDASDGGKRPLLNGKCSGIVVRDESVGSLYGRDSATFAIKDQLVDPGLEAVFSPNQGQRRASNKPPPKGSAETRGESAISAGFRLCQECREIMFRGQYMEEQNSTPPYVQLYDELVALQREIETTLPEFQELLMGLRKSDVNSTLGTSDAAVATSHNQRNTVNLLQLQRDAANARKQLLANFANYDALAKRIRDLPDGGNVSLKRLKDAIWVNAGVFLQTNMFPLQSLPKLENSGSRHRRDESKSSSSSLSKQLPQTPHAGELSVLHEQRDQIAAFLTRAQKERKLNDATVLRKNLEELEAEIARLTRPS